MAQQMLQTIITLSGQVDNSFGNIGTALINVGNHVDALSQKIINFGKESVEEYVEYDDVMREVQALGEYDNKTMSILNDYNKTIAQTSKYTMEQAAQAEVMMAQLGLNMNQTKTLMPTVMNLATAANIDLADSLDYLYYTLNALGMPMEYANTLSDQMSKTAALSAADIDTLGQSMQRLGSGAQFFAGGSTEILAILGGISQFGSDMQGSNAGTQLRNFMLTLLAPTKSKNEIIQSLKVTEQEWAEFESYMEDAGIDVNNTADAMNELGLSVYDSTTGELKPAIQIIGELEAALSGMSEAEKNETLGNLFGKRTTTTALNLISALGTIIEYQDAIANGSTGYTETMAENMEGGLGGALREFTAAWDAFETTIGEEIAPTVEGVADGLTDIVNGLTNMDEDAMDALVAGATALAAAGPALLLAGGAFRLIGFAMTPVGAATLALTGFVTAYSAVQELVEGDMAANFGDMDIDSSAIGEYVNTLGEDFKASYTEINAFKDALNGAVESYTTASTTFASDILTAMLTGATLSDTDKASLMSLGTDMHAALIEGITNSTAATMSYWEMLFGGEGVAEYDPQYQDIIDLTNTSYQNALSQAASISQGFRDALTSAFDDGTISEAEYAELQSWMQAYNDAMAQAAAEAQSEEDYVNMQMLLHKAQTASLDSIKSMAAEVEAERDSILAEAEQNYLQEYFKLQYRGAGEEELKAAEDAYNAHVTEQNAKYDDILLKMWESSMQQSDLAGAYATLGDYTDRFFAGELSADSVHGMLKELYGGNSYAGEIDSVLNGQNVSTQLGEYMARIISSLGGYEGISEKIDFYEAQGDTGGADQLRKLYAMEQFINNFAQTGVISDSAFGWFDGKVYSSSQEEYGMLQANRSSFDAEMDGYLSAYTAESAKHTIDLFSQAEQGRMDSVFTALGNADAAGVSSAWSDMSKLARSEYANLIDSLAAVYDFEKVLAGDSHIFAEDGSAFRDEYAAYSLLYGNASANPNDYLITATVEPVVPEGAVEAAAGDATIPAEVVPETDGDTSAVEIPAEVTGQTEAAANALADAQGVMDTGLTADASVTGLYSSAVSERDSAQAYLSANPGTWRVNTVRSGSLTSNKMSLFAEGGRATEASIFGEAGPEWAIPEEHSDRVASLFNAAREAAGFTWPELIARNGGLNAGGGTPAQIIYSPTIYANDANGVEQKLIEDKERLDRWWSEKQMHDDVEVYA